MYSLIYDNTKTCNYFNDIRDLWQAACSIYENQSNSINEKTEQEIYKMIAQLGFEQTYKTNYFTIKCFNEDKLVEKIQAIADKITSNTAIDNKYIGLNANMFVWQFNFMKTYLKFQDSSGFYMHAAPTTGVDAYIDVMEIKTKSSEELIQKASIELNKLSQPYKDAKKRAKHYVESNKEIIEGIRTAINNKVEWHSHIYKDEVWTVQIERHPYGVIRFWASREDKNGNYNSTLVTPYELLSDGTMRYGADFKLTKNVKNKIESTYKALLKANLWQ